MMSKGKNHCQGSSMSIEANRDMGRIASGSPDYSNIVCLLNKPKNLTINLDKI